MLVNSAHGHVLQPAGGTCLPLSVVRPITTDRWWWLVGPGTRQAQPRTGTPTVMPRSFLVKKVKAEECSYPAAALHPGPGMAQTCMPRPPQNGQSLTVRLSN
ncbi:Hypp9529, partial [Branchiostoma lanceolatum]